MKIINGEVIPTNEEASVTLLPCSFPENTAWDLLPKVTQRQVDIQNDILSLHGFEDRERSAVQFDRHRVIAAAVANSLKVLIEEQITDGLEQFYKDIDDFRDEATKQD